MEEFAIRPIYALLLVYTETCLEIELKFFHEGEARTVDFFMFSAAKRESESESFALGPTAGTGNDKRRTLRKSSLYREC